MIPASNRLCIIAGMPRASTTFLYHTLARHPDIFVPSRKELEYFSLNSDRGSDWYLNFFKEKSASQVGFDISPLYFFDPGTPAAIRDYFEQPKVVLIIRDPAEFLVSFFKNRVAADGPGLEFDAYLDGYRYTKDGSSIDLAFRPGVFEECMRRFSENLGSGLLLVDFRLVGTEPLRVLRAIERFCGLAGHFDDDNFENVKVNASDQLNIRLVNRLMHQKWFADLVTALVPKKLIMAARYRLQTAGRPGRPQFDRDIESQRLEQADRLYAGDAKYIQDLFSDSPLRLGNGEPY